MRPMAVALPVVVGMSERPAARARRRSLCGASMIVCVLVASCTVVIAPCSMPRPSWMTFTTGARQLVVQDALVSRAVLGRVIKVIVDAHDDVEGIATFDRCGHDDLLHALVEIRGELFGRAEFAAAFEHDVHAIQMRRQQMASLACVRASTRGSTGSAKKGSDSFWFLFFMGDVGSSPL
jgi:hypothetical protein